ncbi:MAG: phosphodiester glycosidase family protein, partial [Candidatus Sericytochromatia bacterium]|nr:phosphodiester glycosidase family protein [Candidatus Sericytochromatia bacterium]
YFLNSQEVTFLPEIDIEGSTKFLPVEIVKSIGASLILDTNNKTAYVTNNDETFVLKENTKQIYLNNKSYLISDAPIWKNNTLYVPSNFIIKLGILVSENKYRNELNVIKTFNIINDLTTNFDNLESKITFNFNTLPVYDIDKGNGYYKITLFGSAAKDFEALKKQMSTFTNDFKKIDLDNSIPGILTISFYPKANLDFSNIYYLDKPARLVIQFPKLYKNELREKVSTALYKSKIAESNYQGANKINILELNTKKDLILKPILARDNNYNFKTKEVSKLSKDFNAVAGINAGYFSTKTKFPLGLVYINNQLISSPIYNRSALLFNKDGSFEIKNIDLNIFLKTKDNLGMEKSLKINAFNQPPQKDQIVLFTYNYGKDNLNKKKQLDNSDDELTTNDDFSAYLVSKQGDRLVKLTDFSDSIPTNNFVIYASGKGRDNLDKIIESMNSYQLSFNYSESLDKAFNAIGGGPTLVRDGGINITSQLEKFKPDIAEGKAPRTSLAILKNNKILILTVDGRQESSKGMTLEELAYYLKTYEANNAINFDGGGSTAMFYNKDLINSVSDPKERKVSNGLFIFKSN